MSGPGSFLQSKGEVFSHPYSSPPVWGGVIVGDAGANNIVFVSNSGYVKLIKSLPAEPIIIDAAVITLGSEVGMMIPECMVGLKYCAQAVPTDVEVNGSWIYYSVLPGVPGESMGVGKVYRANLFTGNTQLIAEGLAAPTGIAVSYDNTIYVAQLMGDGVSVVNDGKVTYALAETGGNLMTMRLR
ncbi:ScyD/ScyE family protein [Arthrobacter sp. AQ5-05]|uniref:ScyD/ScyE family protein n=1 Tax=Arthrobacter sp. AQ5-05 TaxID=2184581 RepID=UPI0012B510F4|nr:ScyD/ScyE family protein [Arthrobacter sp. AQ5-05]